MPSPSSRRNSCRTCRRGRGRGHPQRERLVHVRVIVAVRHGEHRKGGAPIAIADGLPSNDDSGDRMGLGTRGGGAVYTCAPVPSLPPESRHRRCGRRRQRAPPAITIARRQRRCVKPIPIYVRSSIVGQQP